MLNNSLRGELVNIETALLVLDMQKDFISENGKFLVAKHQIEPMLEKVNSLIKHAKSHHTPVVYVGNEFRKSQFISNFFRSHAATKGEQGAELDQRLNVINNIYFSKHKGDALSNKKLVSYLHSLQIREVIIVGVYAEGCVLATAKGCLRNDFSVVVISDAVAGASDQKKKASLLKLSSLGVNVKESSQWLESVFQTKDNARKN
ncbi:Nicotinamidase-related amidase [Bacillus sp. cl95]|nr:Nicotinamidase-related amidase [Bacillus sp. UNCCL13]SFQ84083.1 Nicotinamidase-related amidase [Bacillus sp. cl95]